MKYPVDYNLTLEQIENDHWPEPEYDSYLVQTCHSLRKKTLKDFTVEDLRIMIGQNMSLQILIPLAIEELQENIVAEGDYYEGDLLYAVLSSEESFWLQHKALWQRVVMLYQENFEPNYLIKNIVKAYGKFMSMESFYNG